MKFRSFVALEIPPQVQLEIADKVTKLVQSYPKPLIRWVEPGNLHLTLCFLAERTSNELANLASSIQNSLRKIKPFNFRLTKPGTFPKKRNPKVIWVGIEDPPGIYQLQKIIEEMCLWNGFIKESRRFTPHLTLGRVGTNRILPNVKEFFDSLSSISFESIKPVNITDIKIYKSELKPTGSIYKVLYSIPIGGD
jgi:RNA 2',3'-cyclic 3'-phosphodiesterase